MHQHAVHNDTLRKDYPREYSLRLDSTRYETAIAAWLEGRY